MDLWAKDIGRNVEANVGYIQNYSKNLGPFEGFVAVKDDLAALRYNRIADISHKLIKRLPFRK